MNVNNKVVLNGCHYAHALNHCLYVLVSRIHNLYLKYNVDIIYYEIFLCKNYDFLASLSCLIVKDSIYKVQERIFSFVYLIHIVNNLCM